MALALLAEMQDCDGMTVKNITNHPYNFPPSPDSIAGDLTEKRFRIKVEGGAMNFRCLEHGADEITFKREDGEGFVEMDLLEFLDQYSLGRIQLIESLGFQEESN